MIQIIGTKGQQWYRFTVLPLLIVVALSSHLAAGGYPDNLAEGEQQQVVVSLHGVNRFGAVQLFDYLLTRTPKIVSLKQIRLQLSADDRFQCRADWAVTILNGDGAEILHQLRGIINDLDPEKQNEILYEAPFVVMKEDLELLKRVIPLESMVGFAAFGVEGLVNEENEEVDKAAWANRNSNIPWYSVEGAGFE